MDSHVIEWLNLILRWIHIIAGIAWIGSSFFFMWLDSHLTKPKTPSETVEGELWMVHSGGFYQVEKYFIRPNEVPPDLHWFKWEAGFTWLSGFCLLGVVYYMGGGAYLIDPAVANLTPGIASLDRLGLFGHGLGLYDLLWKSPLGKNIPVAGTISLLALVGATYGLTQVFSARGAYIHVGAILGSLMAGNVWMRIIPYQRKMVKAAERGEKPDFNYGHLAKIRSIHNNYMTLPLIFIMISNHFPSTYGHSHSWLILLGLIVVGAGVRHYMNVKNTFSRFTLGVAMAGVVALFLVTAPAKTPAPATGDTHGASSGETVKFADVQKVLQQRCVACHSAKPTDDVFKVAPNGIMFDQPAQIKQLAERIHARAVQSKTMPLANKTGITEEERALLGRWFAQGAPVE